MKVGGIRTGCSEKKATSQILIDRGLGRICRKDIIMALPFYARSETNQGYIKNMEVIAFDPDRGLPGGGQPQIYKISDDKYYLYATMRNEIGIWDVSDPSKPELLRHFAPVDEETYPTTDNPKIQVANDLLIVAHCSGSGPAFMERPPIDPEKHKAMNGISIYSIKEDPVNPEFLSYWDNGVPFAMGVHRFMYDGGRYAYLSSDARGFEGLILRIIDLEDPKNPKEAGRWWLPEQFADGYPGRTFDPGAAHVPSFMDKGWLHGPPFVVNGIAYCGYSGAGVVTLDVSDPTRPMCLGRLQLMPAFSGGLAGARTHTVMKLPGQPFVVATNEGERFHTFDPEELKKNFVAQPMNNLHMIDVRDPSRPTLVAEFPYPEVPENFPFKNFNEAYLGVQGPFGPHNIHEPMPGKEGIEKRGDRVYCCYFGAGLRVYDVSDPYYVKEIAYFIPPNPANEKHPFLPGPVMAVTEDVVVDDRGYIYITTNGDGMYILRALV